MIFEFIIMMIGKDSFLEMKFFGIDGDSACFELSNCTYHEFFFFNDENKVMRFKNRPRTSSTKRTVPEASIHVQHQFERQEKLK